MLQFFGARQSWSAFLLVSFLSVALHAAPPASTATPLSYDQAVAAAAKMPTTAYEKKCRAFIQAKGSKNESVRLKEIFDFQWNYLMTTYPEWATYVGHPGQNDRWTDNSFTAMALRDRELKCLVDMAKSVNRAALKADDKLNFDLFLRNAEMYLEGTKFPDEFLAVNQMGGAHQDLAQMFVVMPAATEADYKNILARLKTASTVLDWTMLAMKEGLQRKVTPPKITLRDVPAQVQAMIVDDPMKSPMLTPFKEIPASIPAEKAAKLRQEAVQIFNESLKPKLIEFHKFLVETYVPGARESIAWKDLPNGEAWYAFKVRETTTTNLTPQQIHDIGQAEVTRIRAEMEKVVKEAKFKGSVEDFQKFLRTDKQFVYTKAADLLRDYRDIAKRADPELVKLFGRLPRLPYGVVPVPEYSEKSQATAYYQGGSLQAGRPGQFFANTYDLPSRPKWEMEALTLHEAVPGHHLQISLAQEMDSGPMFRKHDGYTAYVEGWGLYAESLGYEMGFYKDPYSRFGQLTYEMWRAMRLVVDTGIHHLGWSREQAINAMSKQVAKANHDVIVEVDRYIVWAGQATGYKIGQLKFKELREKATRELGDRFDIRKFHDTVLGKGSLPLDVLEKTVDEYITLEKAKPKPRST